MFLLFSYSFVSNVEMKRQEKARWCLSRVFDKHCLRADDLSHVLLSGHGLTSRARLTHAQTVTWRRHFGIGQFGVTGTTSLCPWGVFYSYLTLSLLYESLRTLPYEIYLCTKTSAITWRRGEYMWCAHTPTTLTSEYARKKFNGQATTDNRLVGK